MKNQDKITKRIALLGLLTALAMIAGYVEAIFPVSVGIPGVKLGLANVVTVFALYQVTPRETFMIQLTRIMLVSLLFGNMSTFFYSLAGGLLSLCVMYVTKKNFDFGIFGVSVLGGVSHNIGQLIVAALVLHTFNILYYGAVLLVTGTVTGIVIAFLAMAMIKRTEKIEK